MACGTPTLLLNNPLNREVVGDVGIYLDSKNVAEVASCLKKIIDQGLFELKHELIEFY